MVMLTILHIITLSILNNKQEDGGLENFQYFSFSFLKMLSRSEIEAILHEARMDNIKHCTKSSLLKSGLFVFCHT